MYVVGKKSDLSLLGNTGIRCPEPSSDRVLEMTVQRYGGVITDYSVYQVTDGDAQRILLNDEYSLLWDSIPEISGIDFLPEDNKRWVRTLVSNENFLANGTASINVTFQVWKADKSGIDTAISGQKVVEIQKPDGNVCKIAVTLSSGQATVVFKTTEAGQWVFPAPQKYISSNVRVYENKYVNALYPVG